LPAASPRWSRSPWHASWLLSFLFLVGCRADVAPTDWNVLLITLDTVRADALGAYGQPSPTTPVLDRVAAEGVLFEHVTSAAPHTLASHASIMTGLYPFAHGARANYGSPLALENETLAEILAAAGHRTAAEIAAPVLHASTRIAQGFEPGDRALSNPPQASSESLPPAAGMRRIAENVTARGLETIERWQDEPFFLWLHYFDAHLPYLERPEDRALFPDAPYLAQVHALDRSLGRILDALEESGLRERTLVVITSDHGEGLGEHDEPTHSYFVYDSTMRVPLLLWGPPSLPRGRRVAGNARTVDILPTVLDLMGRTLPEGLHGRSLVAALATPDGVASGLAYGETLDLYRIFGTTPIRLLRQGRWKYIHSAKPELYDLEADPAESHDLIANEPQVSAELEARLRGLLKTTKTRAETAAPSDSGAGDPNLARLEALGYVIPAENTQLDDEIGLLLPLGPSPEGLAQAADLLSRAKGSIAARRWSRAISRLAPLAQTYPESATVLAMLAEAHAGAGDLDRALGFFDRALAMSTDPCNEVRLDRARALDRFGRSAERILTLERALESCPDSATYLNELAWTLATTPTPEGGDGKRALIYATRLIELGAGQSDPNQLDTLAAAHAAAGDPARALSIQQRALSLLVRRGAAQTTLDTYRSTAEGYRRRLAEQTSANH